MAKFKIELEWNDGRVLLTDFDSDSESNITEMTFDEELQEGENDSYTLTFSIPQKIDNIPIGTLIAINRPLWLTFGHPERSVRMVISAIAEQQGETNRIYEVEAQDYASYVYSKNNAGLYFDSFEDEDFWNKMEKKYKLNKGEGEGEGEGEEEIIRPTVVDIAEYILERGWLRREIDQSPYIEGWEVEYFRDEEIDGVETEAEKYLKYVNIEVDNSNTYNALVELANASETILRFDYEGKYGTVYFIDKEDDRLKKQFLLREDFNLQELNLSYEGSELFGLLYIDGVKDEEDEYTFAEGDINYKDNFIYELDYFVEKGIITQAQKGLIDEKIRGSNGQASDLWKLNSRLEAAIELRHTLEGKISELETKIETRSYSLVVEPEAKTFAEDYKLFEELFKREVRDETSGAQESSRDFILEEYLEIGDANSLVSENVRIGVAKIDKLLVKFNNKSYLKLEKDSDTDTKNIVVRIDGVEYDILFSSRVSVDEYENIKNWEVGSDDEIYLHSKSSSLVNHKDLFEVEKLWVKIIYIKSRPKTTTLYPYFELLNKLGGEKLINEKILAWGKLIDGIKFDWKSADDEIDKIGKSGTADEDDIIKEDQRRAYLEEQIDMYRLMIGEYEGKIPDGEEEKQWTMKEGSFGYYTLVKKTLDKIRLEYGAGNTDEKDALSTFHNLLKEKRKFWFELKDQYGAHIFTEGYYEDEIETHPDILYHQAKRAYKNHKKPLEKISATYINLSDIVGIQLREPRVGDYIWVERRDEKIESDQKLKIESISRTLRLDGNIEYEITKFSPGNRLIEKLLKQLQEQG